MFSKKHIMALGIALASLFLLTVTRSRESIAEDIDLPELSSLEGDSSEANTNTAAAGAENAANFEDEAMRELEQAVESDRVISKPAVEAARVEAPPAELAPTRPREDFASVTSEIPAYRNEITNVEFKMEGANSRIVIATKRKPVFKEVKNLQMKQVVYYFENTATAQSLQRAFDTSEFVSPVALFTVLQMPSEKPALSKLIVQLREDSSPSVRVSDRAMAVEFSAPSKQSDSPRLVSSEDPNKATEENIYSGSQVFSGQMIKRLEIKNSDVQDVLRLIARTSGYNVVVGDDVTGKIGTLSLENIPWDQAFALVLQSKKLGYIRQGGVLRVGTLASLKNEKEEALANEQSRIRVEPLKTVLIPISYARASDIAPRVKAFNSERGSVDTDERTNTVIVRDVASVVERSQKLIAALDVQPPRVSISGKVVEMTNQFTRDVGLSNIAFTDTLAGVNLQNTISTASSAGSSATVAINASRFANLSARLALGELDSSVKVLANPSVSVVANQQASISSILTLNRPIPATAPSGTSAGTTGGFAAFTATLSLNVTPIVAGDGSIFLNVKVNNDTLLPTANEVSVNSRSMSTQVLIENGDTAVIGGLFQSTQNTARSGVAYLMRIPILGFLFGGTNVTDNSTEIFVFLTAKIMNAEEAFRRTF